MKCLKCNHEQDTGKFCGKCGTKFEEINTNNEQINDEPQQVNEDPTPEVPVHENPIHEDPVKQVIQEQTSTVEQPIPPTQPVEPNAHVENVKVKSKMYLNYFMQYLKNPSLVYNRGEAEFSNGLISIFVLAALIALTFYSSVNSFTRSAFDMGPGFIQLFITIVLFICVAQGIVAVSLYMINKFFGPNLTFKSIISFYGGHLGPSIIVAVASLVFVFLKSFTFGSLALSVSILFTISILPLYLISVLLSKKSTSLDSLYGYIIYIAVSSLLFFIFITIMADSSLGRYIDEIMYFF